MGDFELRTVRGYDFYVCASIIQKAIRRGDAIYAGYFAHELVMSGYGKYVWKRLLTISAEDCYSAVTHEIKALYDACEVAGGVKVDQSTGKAKGRVFISKAILLLCECAKSRDADYLHCLVYDKKMLFDDSYAEKLIADVDEQDVFLALDASLQVFSIGHGAGIIVDRNLIADFLRQDFVQRVFGEVENAIAIAGFGIDPAGDVDAYVQDFMAQFFADVADEVLDHFAQRVHGFGSVLKVVGQVHLEIHDVPFEVNKTYVEGEFLDVYAHEIARIWIQSVEDRVASAFRLQFAVVLEVALFAHLVDEFGHGGYA